MIEARNIPSQMSDASPDGLMKDVPERGMFSSIARKLPSIHLNPLCNGYIHRKSEVDTGII
jgi:hypothetical protein